MSIVSKWVDEIFKNNVPFSFIYKGKYSKDFIGSWDFTEDSINIDENCRKKTFTYKDPLTKLLIVCEVMLYEDFPAVEWTLYFKNENTVETPIIESICAIDTKFQSKGEYNIHRINGNSNTVTDFAPVVTPLSEKMSLDVGCHGGRSSSAGFGPAQLGGCVPFINLEDVIAEKGIILAIGWTGQWVAKFNHDTGSSLRVQAGMEVTHLKLCPGEQIRTPKILTLFWEGFDPQIGNNMLRRFIVTHKIPRINGKPVEIGIGANNHFHTVCNSAANWFKRIYDGSNDITEKNQIELAHKCKELGIEYYWLDAGWSKDGWPFGNGNWFLKKEGFPNGWKNLCATLKELNLKFILWFEPERVCQDSKLWNDHPEWLIKIPKTVRETCRRVAKYELTNRNVAVLNLGNVEARKWLTEHISKMITEQGIDMFRHDCNIELLRFWKYTDSKNRQGITEIKYIEGLYAFWDELLKRHPNLIIDCVATGARRIDLESLSRSIRMWTSDYTVEPIGTQCATFGLNIFLPGHANGIAPENSFSKYVFRSQLSGGASICWDILDKDFPKELARKMINEVKSYRPLFYGDFWPLTPHSVSKKDWIAWQFDRPDMGKGIVFAFRRSNIAEEEIKLSLKGIKKDKKYEITIVDEDRKEILTGEKLIEKGLIIDEQRAPEAILIAYEIVK